MLEQEQPPETAGTRELRVNSGGRQYGGDDNTRTTEIAGRVKKNNNKQTKRSSRILKA